MSNARKSRIALMAAGSLIAASAAVAPAGAADFDMAAHPATIEAPLVHAADHADREAGPAVPRWALLAAAAGALAGLVKLIGARKIVRAAGKGAAITVEAAGKAARAVGRSFASPLRFAALMAGLSLFALTGVGLYDVEWIGGLVAGAALTGMAAYGAMKTRKALSLKPVRVKSQNTVNRN